MLAEFRKYGSLFLLVSVVSLVLSSIPQVLYDGMHTLSYELSIFQLTDHYDLHEQGIDHEHNLLAALDKSKDSQQPSKSIYEANVKLHKIKEPIQGLLFPSVLKIKEKHTFYHKDSYSDGYLETLEQPPDFVG